MYVIAAIIAEIIAIIIAIIAIVLSIRDERRAKALASEAMELADRASSLASRAEKLASLAIRSASSSLPSRLADDSVSNSDSFDRIQASTSSLYNDPGCPYSPNAISFKTVATPLDSSFSIDDDCIIHH